ncbi:MAG: gluconate 2-dehydrogenase subunit 3 family protein [Gemmatimonadales bacterium]
MHRRELLALLGATATASALTPLSATERLELGRRVHRAARQQAPGVLTEAERAVVSRIADLVIPRTDTPGAVDVGVPAFVDTMMAGWYSTPEVNQFRRGLADLDQRAGTGGFAARPESEQAALLTALEANRGEPGTAEAAFRTLKGLVVHGYLTAERVQKEVLRAVIIPGRFDGCIPFQPR